MCVCECVCVCVWGLSSRPSIRYCPLWKWRWALVLKELFNSTSKRDASHSCFISLWPKDECITTSAHSQSEQFFCWGLRQISLPQFSFISPRFKLFDFIFILTLYIFFVSKRKKKKKRKEKKIGEAIFIIIENTGTNEIKVKSNSKRHHHRKPI